MVKHDQSSMLVEEHNQPSILVAEKGRPEVKLASGMLSADLANGGTRDCGSGESAQNALCASSQRRIVAGYGHHYLIWIVSEDQEMGGMCCCNTLPPSHS
jgi:hypothetical protein